MSLILDLIFPKTCFGCGQTGSYFCPKCRKNFKFHSPKFSSHLPKEGSLSLFYYHGLIRQAIQSLKYEFVTDLADEFSSIFSQRIIKKYPDLLNYWQKNNFILTPIPLYPSRQNWRGFNQSQLLSKLIAQKLKLTFSDQIIFRHRPTFTQSHLKNFQKRQQNIKNAFTPILPTPKNLIIFDDVTTSFSTLNSAFNSIKPFALNRCWFLTLSG
jgi:competence protein ComFC